MRRTWIVIAALALPGLAQEKPAAPVNPLAPAAGWWEGSFADKEVRLALRPGEAGRVVGELEVGGATYPVQGRLDEEGGLACAFGPAGGPSWGLVIQAEEGGRGLVLTSGGAVRRLDRQASGTTAGELLSHVRKGQRWVFDMTASGLEMRQVYEVTAVEARAVKYKLVLLMRMPGAAELTQQGEPVETEWALPAPAPGEQALPQDAKVSRERVTLAGKEWDCQVTETSGVKVWIPMKGETPTWPPFVKLEGPSQAALVEVLEPRK